MSDSDIKVFKPNLTLKNKISPGGSAKALFPKEVVESCQTLLNDFKDSFFTDASSEFSQVNIQLRSKQVSAEQRANVIGHIAVLKGRSETMGLGLISALMHSLQDYLENEQLENFEDNVVINKHLEALTVALQQQIADDGGILGKELMETIARLKQKVKKT